LFLLLEHQSKPDHYMAFRLFKYMLNIAEYYMKITKNKPLDEIVEFTGFTKKEIEELQK
ncbi:MAG: Rpn family recombination-promoting nuclease/putative transposase, partial [Rickettsia endosymbiont of Ixodes persulcatus]|nr:Rpn family recombination-promoting nuclease/putative transposase [Rickettsia endosymbiont of Ixodes persulcatus]